MEKINKVVKSLALENQITLEDIPNIDLYMDQVIQLFESKYNDARRNETEKILTKTMINNYAKGKLFMPIKNKKYSKDHLILISLIYQLKGALSINDIKTVLDGVNKKAVEEEFNLEQFYSSYLQLVDNNVKKFKEDIEQKADEANATANLLQDPDADEVEKVLLISSLVHTSNLYRRMAEKLVDQMVIENEQKTL